MPPTTELAAGAQCCRHSLSCMAVPARFCQSPRSFGSVRESRGKCRNLDTGHRGPPCCKLYCVHTMWVCKICMNKQGEGGLLRAAQAGARQVNCERVIIGHA